MERLTLSLDVRSTLVAARWVGTSAAVLAVATVAITLLESEPLAIPDASAVYLLAVVATGILHGTAAAITTSVGSVLLYDFLFTEPRFALTVDDPGEWLRLVLFTLVAISIGQLAASQARRADEATKRATEAQSLFAISRALALSTTVADAVPSVVGRLAGDTELDRVRVALGESPGHERPIADTDPARPVATPPSHAVLARTPGDRPARWVRVHVGRDPARERTEDRGTVRVYRVAIEADGQVLGSVWGYRASSADEPTREATRILALAADQIGQAVRRETLAGRAAELEIARRSDAMKSALLDSVSHDLRTPLASIRAAAGGLMDPGMEWPPDERLAVAARIDQEAERLNDLVRNLLDLSRIEAGAVRPDLELHELEALVVPMVERLRGRIADRVFQMVLGRDLPPVQVDAVFFGETLGNVLENAARYTSDGDVVRVSAAATTDGSVELVVEDSGPGVPIEALPRLFDKFYRVSRSTDGSRRGMGVGLTVAKGLIEAAGGGISARPSQLGGLAIVIRLPTAPEPPVTAFSAAGAAASA